MDYALRPIDELWDRWTGRISPIVGDGPLFAEGTATMDGDQDDGRKGAKANPPWGWADLSTGPGATHQQDGWPAPVALFFWNPQVIVETWFQATTPLGAGSECSVIRSWLP